MGEEGQLRGRPGDRAGRAAAAPAAVPALRVLHAARARTRARSTRSGGTWISASGGWRSTAGAGGCAARATACSPRACRSPVTGSGSRATSSAWSPGWPPASTSRRSAGCSGSTGTRSGGSSRACAPMSSIPTGSPSCTTSGSMRCRGSASTTTSRWSPTTAPARSCGAARCRREGRRPLLRRARSRHRRAPPRPRGDASLSAREQHAAAEPEPPVAERAGQLAAISLDMGAGYAAAARWHAPQAVICIDPFHVVQNANKALDEVRRAYWNELRAVRRPTGRQALQGRPLVAAQSARQAHRQAGRSRWPASRPPAARCGAPTRSRKPPAASSRPASPSTTSRSSSTGCSSRLARSRLEPFIRLGKTIRKHRAGILAAVRLGINQGRTEALNNKVRLIVRRAYGFHTAQAALALVMLTCGPITLRLPHQLHAIGSP